MREKGERGRKGRERSQEIKREMHIHVYICKYPILLIGLYHM